MLRLRLICSFAFFMLAMTGVIHADEQFPFLGEISRGPVNVRAGNNTNFEVVDKLKQGDEVVVVGRNYEWYKVQLPDTGNAFVRGDYIKVIGNTGEMTGDHVNVRAKPNSESSTLGQVRRGEYVRLEEKINDWWRIAPPAGCVAWIHSSFIRLKSPQVPSELIRKPLPAPVETAPGTVVPSPQPATAVPVSVKGRLERLPGSPQQHVHYEIVVDHKPVYYLQDVPHLDNFEEAMVHVEGVAVPHDPSSNYPVLHVKKISLVL